MNKIRIGNDIRLLVSLGESASDWDKRNIKDIQAYLINTSVRDFEKNHWNNAPRFPRDPQSKFFRPSAHNLNRCGRPGYNCWPMDHDPNYVFDNGFHRPVYHGFGLEPGRWPHRWFGWTRHHDPAFGHRSLLDPVELHIDEEFTYHALSKETKGDYNIQVFFPAQDQLMCGTYKLVIVVTSYVAGWGRNNLHTYTKDCGAIFELVDDESGMYGDVTIDASTGEYLGGIDSIIIGSIETPVSHLYITSGETLALGDIDARHNRYQIYIETNGGDITQWEPGDVDAPLTFTSTREHVVMVDNYGTITALSWDDVKDNPNAEITISDGNNIIKTIKVTVVDKDADVIYVGFSTKSSWDSTLIDELEKYDDTNEKFSVRNNVDGAYFWVSSKQILKYLNKQNPLVTVGVTSQRFPVPMAKAVYENDRYWYRSVNKIQPVEMRDIKIETNE